MRCSRAGLITLAVVACAACNDPLAGFGPAGRVRVTVQTLGLTPAMPYCTEVEIHDLTFNDIGQPVLNTERAAIGPDESKLFDAQIGARSVSLRRAPPVNGNCSSPPEDLIPGCLIDGEEESYQQLGARGVVIETVTVREGQTADVQFTVRCM